MHWIKKPKPNHRDARTVTKFLFFPKSIDGETRWLETASWFEVYHYNFFNNSGKWLIGNWIDSKRNFNLNDYA